MKTLLLLSIILFPFFCQAQTWSIDAGGDFVFCDGDEDIQLQGTIINPSNDSLTILWETEYSIGSNTYYAEDFLDSLNSLTPTLNTPNLLAVPELTFYLTVSDTLGNDQIDSVSVFVSSFSAEFEDFQFHINQGDSVTLLISAFAGLPPYTYEWLPNTNIVDNTVRNPIVFPNTSTDYSVTMIDARGCVVPDGCIDVNEVYVAPLSVIELQESGIKWHYEKDHIIIETEQLKEITVALYNICGKPINTFQKTDEILNIDMTNLERGIYFLNIDNKILKFIW